MKKYSPFSFGQVVHEKGFTNRFEEKKIIMETLLSGNSLILISPRRIGKSSLIKQVFSEIEKNNKIAICTLDLTSYRTENHFLEEYARKIVAANTTKLDQWVKKLGTLLKYITPALSYKPDGMEKVSLSFNWSEKKKTKEEILNLPKTMYKVNGKKQLIAIDEFQNIGKFEEAEALKYELRAFWQHQSNTSYCLFGSKRHMMEEIFTSESAPFYNFGHVMKLGRIESKHWIPFLMKKFKSTAKPISKKNAQTICDWMQLHSENVQFLSHFIWSACSTGEINQIHMMDGMKKFLNATSIHFMDLFDRLSNIQINVLVAILSDVEKLTSKETIQTYRLGTSAGALKAKKALIKEDVMETLPSGSYRIINPAFELWFRHKVMNQDIIAKCEAMLE